MNTGFKPHSEWVPEAYKKDVVGNNHPQKSHPELSPLAGKGLYGYAHKKHPAKLGYLKK